MLSEGLPFTVATARSLESVRVILKGLPLRLPVIHFNGAMISDFSTGQHFSVLSFEQSLAQLVAEFTISRMGHWPYVSSFDGEHDHLSYEDIPNLGYDWYVKERVKSKDPRLRQVPRVDKILDEESTICFTVVSGFDVLNVFRQQLEQQFPNRLRIRFFQNPYDRDWYWITIQPYAATKATAIKRLLQEQRMSAQDLTVFGDHCNDQEMFEIAGRAIAVANAIEELRALSTHQIGHHGDDSVVEFIRQDWQLIRPRD